MDDEKRARLISEGAKLVLEHGADYDELVPVMAMAVVCLDLIVDQLAGIESRLGDIDYELKIRRSSTFARSQDDDD